MESEYGAEVFDGDGSIYLDMVRKKVSNEFIGRCGIFDGSRTFTGVTSSSNDYEGEIQCTPILPGRAKQKNEPLTEDGRFVLRSELGELMRIVRIARPGALYGASVSAQTFETVGDQS